MCPALAHVPQAGDPPSPQPSTAGAPSSFGSSCLRLPGSSFTHSSAERINTHLAPTRCHVLVQARDIGQAVSRYLWSRKGVCVGGGWGIKCRSRSRALAEPRLHKHAHTYTCAHTQPCAQDPGRIAPHANHSPTSMRLTYHYRSEPLYQQARGCTPTPVAGVAKSGESDLSGGREAASLAWVTAPKVWGPKSNKRPLSERLPWGCGLPPHSGRSAFQTLQ